MVLGNETLWSTYELYTNKIYLNETFVTEDGLNVITFIPSVPIIMKAFRNPMDSAIHT